MAGLFGGVTGRAAAALLLLFALFSTTAAQTPDTVLPLEPVLVQVTRSTVSADRIPFSISAVGTSKIQHGRPALGLDESLAAVPGVFISNRHNFSVGSRISIRGFGARAAFGVRGVRILMDGIPLTLADGQSTLNNLDLGAAGRIEVIRGPASALYGNATGGVISVVTEDPPASAFGADARVTVGNYGTDDWSNLRRTQIKSGRTFATGDWLLSASRLELAGYREHSSTENVLVNARLRLRPGENTALQFIVNGTDVPRAESPGSLPADTARVRPRAAWPNNVRTRSGEAAHQIQGGATLSHTSTLGRTDLMAYGLKRGVTNPLPFAYIRIDRDAGGARLTHNGMRRVAGAPASFTVGADIDAQWDTRREAANDNGRPGTDETKNQRDYVRSIGPFAQIHWQPVLNTGLHAAIRYDRVHFATDDLHFGDGDASGERTLSAWSPSLGATYAPRSGLTLFANLATAFQTPTTTELINRPPPPGEPCCPAGFNTGLEPQRALSAEFGGRGARGSIGYEIALYRVAVRDELTAFQVPEAAGRDFFRNLGRSAHAGLELLLAWRPTDAVTGSLTYTFNDFTVVEDGAAQDAAGKRIPGVPRHLAAAQLALVPSDRLSLDGDVRYQGEMFVDDANTVASAAATVIDARVGFRPSRRYGMRLYLGGSNLTDARYSGSVAINAFGGRYFEPAPGRAWHVSLGWAFGR